MKAVKYLVPATTSNLGPGFDTLGLALDWSITVEARIDEASTITSDFVWSGPGSLDEIMAGLLAEIAREWETVTRADAPPLAVRVRGDVPLARGLGSSACLRLGLATALNDLNGKPLDDQALLELVCRLEHHTDNATPAQQGGLTVSGWDGGRVRWARFEAPPRYRFVTLVPDRSVSTEEARKILPASVPRADAVANLQHALWLVRALAEDRPDELSGAFADRLHQPYREKVMPFMPRVFEEARRAGAYGSFLSGSGSTLIAVTDETNSGPVARAMESALAQAGESGACRVLQADNQGIRPA